MDTKAQAKTAASGGYSTSVRNAWRRAAKDGHWPLALDLGRNIGRPRWWAGLGVLCSGLIAAIAIGLAGPRESASPASSADLQGHLGLVSGAEAAEMREEKDAVVSSTVDAEPNDASIPLPSRPLILLSLADAPQDAASLQRRERIAVGRGDTLMDVVLRAGAERREAYAAITALSTLINPRRIGVGQAVELAFAHSGEGKERLVRLALRNSFDERVAAERIDDASFEALREPLETTRLLDFRSGVIEDSLYLAARRAGVPVETIVALIRLYSFNVDFQREIRPGDRFELLYERQLAAEDGEIENGGILYAKLTLRGRERSLYRHRPIDGNRDVDYFDAAGESVRKALMKTPLDGARLTSRFGRRKHPVLGYVRSHKGADFGAPTGTPVYAAGDGVVERASRYGSYGNYIRIRHNSTDFKTAYAHLSGYARGVRAGARVSQGEVIGYVGATGRVTGPHLHYEVFQGERRVDPLSLDLPSGRILSGEALAAFEAARETTDSDRQALAHAASLVHSARNSLEDEDGRKASALP